MKIKTDLLKGFIGLILLAGIMLFAKTETASAQQAGLTPENYDGFETADWQNFRPRYVGSLTDFIRPRFTVTDDEPITGNYSLRWDGGEREHQWLMLSNAFYKGRPFTVSVSFRADSDSDNWSAGLYLLETYERFSGLQVHSSGGGVQLDQSEWNRPEDEAFGIISGTVYTFSLELDEYGNFSGSVKDAESGDVLMQKRGKTAISPAAIGIYVHTDEGSSDRLYFDDVRVDASDYKVTSGEWSRAPQPHYVVLPRLPDVTQEEGNWVGGHSVMKTDDGRYLMWYRIRDNQVRGKGYGFATSDDGVNWHKYENNPVFLPHNRYASNEKISVLKIDGIYRGWYTVEYEGVWITKHITSEDGIHWENDEPVIDDMMCKDADVVYVDGEYFLYCIGSSNTAISVHTSEDGLNWEMQETYEMGTHRHLAAYYVQSDESFGLYPTAGARGVSYASSHDGIHFEPFVQTWSPPAVGLDDWVEAGITYLSFLRNKHGHISDESTLPVYYQARNTYANNIPGWLYHGGERVVLAGKFNGIYLGIPTTAMPDGTYNYDAFPFETEKADGFDVMAAYPTKLTVGEWNPDGQRVSDGTIETAAVTMVQWRLKNLEQGADFILSVDGEEIARERAGYNGLLFRTILSGEGEKSFAIERVSE